MSQHEFIPLTTAPSPSSRQPKISRYLLILVSLIALSVAIYLTVLKATGRISNLAGCGGEGGCANLLGGRWSSWMLVPVSFWAILAYLPLLVLACLGLTTPLRRRLSLMITSVLVFGAVWFLAVQAFIEQHFCPYCCGLHLCGLIAFGCTLVHILPQDPSESLRSVGYASVTGLVGVVVLIGGQVWGPQPDTHEITQETLFSDASEGNVATSPESPADDTLNDLPSPESNDQDDVLNAMDEDAGTNEVAANIPSDPADNNATSNASDRDSAVESIPTSTVTIPPPHSSKSRIVSFFDGAIQYDTYALPVIGDPEAPHVIVKYFDYTCRACRRMHDDLEKLQAHYPGQIAVIVLPCPLDHECNPHVPAPEIGEKPAHEHSCDISRVALGVWQLNPQEFEAFHNEMFKLQGRVTGSSALLIANSAVGDNAEAASQSEWVVKTLQQTVSVYGRLKERNPRMPKVLIGGRKMLHGVVADEAKFDQLMREQLMLQPAGS